MFSGKELFDDCADVFLAVLECSVAKATSCRLIQRDLIEAGCLPHLGFGSLESDGQVVLTEGETG